jgi:hypothetical protein
VVVVVDMKTPKSNGWEDSFTGTGMGVLEAIVLSTLIDNDYKHPIP